MTRLWSRDPIPELHEVARMVDAAITTQSANDTRQGAKLLAHFNMQVNYE